MSDRPPVELTRERLEAALAYVRRPSNWGDVPPTSPLGVIFAAAERLLAPPASDEELAPLAFREFDDEMTRRGNWRLGYRACERRLLLPADETGGGR